MCNIYCPFVMLSVCLSVDRIMCAQVLCISYQGSFCVCAQPMRGDVTLWRCLSLAGHIHKLIPVLQYLYMPDTFILFVLCLRQFCIFDNTCLIHFILILQKVSIVFSSKKRIQNFNFCEISLLHGLLHHVLVSFLANLRNLQPCVGLVTTFWSLTWVFITTMLYLTRYL